jgi:hypothetical protein
MAHINQHMLGLEGLVGVGYNFSERASGACDDYVYADGPAAQLMADVIGTGGYSAGEEAEYQARMARITYIDRKATAEEQKRLGTCCVLGVSDIGTDSPFYRARLVDGVIGWEDIQCHVPAGVARSSNPLVQARAFLSSFPPVLLLGGAAVIALLVFAGGKNK